MPKRIKERYLGDGVYASFDGFNVILDLRDQLPTWPITKIFMEERVLREFERFVADLRKEYQDNGVIE